MALGWQYFLYSSSFVGYTICMIVDSIWFYPIMGVVLLAILFLFDI